MTIDNDHNKSIEPKLEAPGAGIGFLPTLFLRYFIKPFVAARTNQDQCERNYRNVNAKILNEIEGLTDKQLNTKILVPPQKGLEDSSRYWSISMTLEHLYIVSRQIYDLIILLSDGKTPNTKADTALVKPKNQYTSHEMIVLFNNLIDQDFNQLNKKIKNINHTQKFEHPWFGAMNALGWYWLLGIHHLIHLKQIKEIKKQLLS